MDSQPRGTNWLSILLLVFSLCAIALTILGSISTLVLMIIDEVNLVSILLASAMFSFALLLAPAAWFSLQQLRGRQLEPVILPTLPPWAWITLPSLWILAMILATLFYTSPGSSVFVPGLHFIAIALPIYLVIRLGINRIPLGSGQRAWGAFGSGMILGPVLSAIAEIAIVVFGLIFVGIFLGLNPEKAIEIQSLINQIENAPDLDSIIDLIGPILNNPLALMTALILLSVLVPFIEEIAKSTGLWLVAGRLSSPAQGFPLGLLSGAGFALAESLLATLSPDETWAVTLSIRALSGSMHMLASGLAGWGIAYARLEKRYFRMIGMLLLAMLLHGAWNAGAVLAVAGGLRVTLALPDLDLLGTFLTLAGGSLLTVLTIGMFMALIIINRKIRSQMRPAPQENPEISVRVE